MEEIPFSVQLILWAVTRIYSIFGVLKCISSKWNYTYILHSFDMIIVPFININVNLISTYTSIVDNPLEPK